MCAMPLLAERLDGFAAALLDPARAIPLGLVGPDGEPSTKRFAVYRNNVVVGLIDAIKANFPAVCRIVGDEFFREMARAFVVSEPPVSPILLDYGDGFADFITGFEPAHSLPYLADVARIERAWMEAYHSREAIALSPAALAEIPTDLVADACFKVHPTLRTVRSQFPALTIWRMNVADGVPAPVDLESGGEDTLVMRPGANVEARAIPPGGVEFLTALASGKTLWEAAKTAMDTGAAFDLAANLSALISAGAFVDCSFAENACDIKPEESCPLIEKTSSWRS
jgi:hypothetical protein